MFGPSINRWQIVQLRKNTNIDHMLNMKVYEETLQIKGWERHKFCPPLIIGWDRQLNILANNLRVD